MEKKQTAVEWLLLRISIAGVAQGTGLSVDEITEQAKEMEKEQIIDAYTEGYDIRDDMGSLYTNPTGKEYYNETYNS